MKIKKFENHLIYSSETIRKSIVKLGKLKKQFCIVIDKKMKFKGTLTDGDIRRGLLNNFNIKDKIENIYKKNSVYIDQNFPELKTRSILERKKI